MDTTMNNENAATATNASTNNSVTNNVTESSASSSSKENNGSNNTLKKRVQFSTQNSMVQVPRSGTSSTSIYHMPNLPSTSTDIAANGGANNSHNHSTSTYATIYSNDYEPIGSEQNSTNHYVDMESKLGDEHRPVIMEKSKTPPALPPKPANLMKLRQLLKFPATSLLKQQQSLKQVDNESEPDYCSISEVHEAINTKVQIVVDVHKIADDDLSSASSHASDDARTDFTDETFSDVPKLPNVAAIISPKKESTGAKQIAQEAKFVVKSSPAIGRTTMADQQQPMHATPMTTSMSNILSEINIHKANNGIGSTLIGSTGPKKAPLKLMNQHNKMTTIEETSTKIPQSITAKLLPPMKPNDKMLMPIQAEFDWYNLDAEYGRMTTIETSGKDGKDNSQNNNSGNGSGNNFGVEYNLDAEFSLTSNPSPTGDNNNLPSLDMRNSAMKLHHKKFTNKSNGNDANDVSIKSFDSFLEHTGLTAKPLPQKRKIFYSAPFIWTPYAIRYIRIYTFFECLIYFYDI